MVTARILFISFIFSIISISATAKPLRVAVSANFAKPVENLLAEFAKTHPNQAQISVASTGVLYQQIRHGAPFDMLFAADVRRPELLEQQGFIDENSRKTYAFGQIALWSAVQEHVSLQDLTHHEERIAIAGPHLAPYGFAAKEALISLGLWRKYHNNIIVGTNINQTYQQTRTGAVQYGIISYSQLLISKVGSGVLVPINLYSPIEQQLIIIKDAENIELARQFSDFIMLPSSQKLIQSYGYLLKEDIKKIEQQDRDLKQNSLLINHETHGTKENKRSTPIKTQLTREHG